MRQRVYKHHTGCFYLVPDHGSFIALEVLHPPAHAVTAEVLRTAIKKPCIKQISMLYSHEEQTSFTTVHLVVDYPGSRQ